MLLDVAAPVLEAICSLAIHTHAYLPQYHSFLHLEHLLLASVPHSAHFGDPDTRVSNMSKLYVSTHL